jgi:hypothetical protein
MLLFLRERRFDRGVCRVIHMMRAQEMDQAQKLRDLASWYREFAERAENPAIWDARLRTAEDLEREAGNIERRSDRHLARAH